MSERKSRLKLKDPKPQTPLRRSPRLSNINPRTPQPVAEKIRASHFVSTPTKTPQKREEISPNEEGKRDGSKNRAKSSKGCQKSAKTDIDLQKRYVIEKRVTRSSVRKSDCVNNREGNCAMRKDFGKRVSVLPKEMKDKVSVESYEQCVSNFEKRVTRGSVRTSKCVNNQEGNCAVKKDFGKRASVSRKEVKAKASVKPYEQCVFSIEKRVTRSSIRTNINQQAANGKWVVSVEEKLRGDVEIGMRKKDEKERGVKKGIGDKDCEKKVLIGEKRKRGEVEKESETLRGWTKEQESALGRAYYTAKPTPHFWKKVARMVPGKSAEECFERIHSDYLTPPQPHTRLVRKEKPSSLSFSASKLLSPADKKSKRLKSSKRNCLLAQKTVRNLLAKQLNEDQDHEPDFFAVLEPTIDPSSLNFQEGTAFSSPTPNLGSCILTRCRERSSSARKKQLSRLNNSSKAVLVSPLVLKPIKNKALHEKYIDQLHNRDAKRKVESLRNAKRGHGMNEKNTSHSEVNSVKVAKDVLIFEAQDAINQFRSFQSSLENNIADIDDDSGSSDGDEGEDEL